MPTMLQTSPRGEISVPGRHAHGGLSRVLDFAHSTAFSYAPRRTLYHMGSLFYPVRSTPGPSIFPNPFLILSIPDNSKSQKRMASRSELMRETQRL